MCSEDSSWMKEFDPRSLSVSLHNNIRVHGVDDPTLYQSKDESADSLTGIVIGSAEKNLSRPRLQEGFHDIQEREQS